MLFKCLKCLENKEKDAFGRGPKNNRCYICCTCKEKLKVKQKQKYAQWYAAIKDTPEYKQKNREKAARNYNPEEKAAYFRKYNAENKEKLITQRHMRRKNKPAKSLFSSAKKRAFEKGYAFNITLEDIKVPEVCPILGIPLIVGQGRPIPSSPSLDRIKPELGYTKGNVRVVSHRANQLKSDGTLEEMRLIVRDLERLLS